MPFGFDPVEAEKVVKEIKEETCINYVAEVVDWLLDGGMRPLKFIWDDGREYKINKIIAIR